MFRFASVVPAMALALSFATTAAAQTEPLRIQNDSAYTVMFLYASPVTVPEWNWDEDLLGSNTLAPGNFIDITFRNVSECWYDVLFRLENGTDVADQVNICQVGYYSFNY